MNTGNCVSVIEKYPGSVEPGWDLFCTVKIGAGEAGEKSDENRADQIGFADLPEVVAEGRPVSIQFVHNSKIPLMEIGNNTGNQCSAKDKTDQE